MNNSKVKGKFKPYLLNTFKWFIFFSLYTFVLIRSSSLSNYWSAGSEYSIVEDYILGFPIYYLKFHLNEFLPFFGIVGPFIPILLLFISYLSVKSWNKSSKRVKKILVISLVLMCLLFGYDELFVNKTINNPNISYFKSCQVDSDCVLSNLRVGMCGGVDVCTNTNWKKYESIVSNAYALTCSPKFTSCSCVDNMCQKTDTDVDLIPKVSLPPRY